MLTSCIFRAVEAFGPGAREETMVSFAELRLAGR